MRREHEYYQEYTKPQDPLFTPTDDNVKARRDSTYGEVIKNIYRKKFIYLTTAKSLIQFSLSQNILESMDKLELQF